MTETLKEIFGRTAYSDSAADKLVYSSDASRIKGEVDCVVWPTNIEQLHKLVKLARRTRKSLAIRGGGTSLVGGCVPQKSIVVNLSRMNRILKVTQDYVIVEAGVVLDDLRKKLPENMSFPIIPSSHNVCTMGGMIATNALGFRSKENGRMLGWVEALGVVDGTGKYIQVNKKDLKNFVGREGMTGIIVEAKIRLAKKEEAKRTVSILKFNTIEALVERLKQLLHEEGVVNVEFLDERCSAIAELGSTYHLLVEYNNDEGNIKDENEVDSAWHIVRKVYSKLMAQRNYIQASPQIPIENIERFLHWLYKRNIPSVGHINLGIMHPYVKDEAALKEMFQFVQKLNGKVSGQYGVGLRGREYLTQEEIANIKELKNKHDTSRILNKGKVIVE